MNEDDRDTLVSLVNPDNPWTELRRMAMNDARDKHIVEVLNSDDLAL